MVTRFEKTGTFFGGALGICAGAAFMYLMDPDRGRRRRAIAIDKIGHYGRIGRRAARRIAIDAAHRTYGTVARARSFFFDRACADDVLVQRVRAHMGHVLDRPFGIDVEAHDGVVMLSGTLHDRDVDAFVDAIEAIPGVCSVENHLSRGNGAQATPMPTAGPQTVTTRKRFDETRAQQALDLGNLDGDPRSTSAALDELHMKKMT